MTNSNRLQNDSIVYNNSRYYIDEEYEGTEQNILTIGGKTFKTERLEEYEEELGYVIEVEKIDTDKYKLVIAWLMVADRGWSEAEYIKDNNEIQFIKDILKEFGIELIVE
jgi:hypothetical protein